ncbi:hypothetical protein TNCV_4654511 [Trichonephila clavipes]|nr:hypothetical protein TNCV_4654511 [Trichonephila clavipes]
MKDPLLRYAAESTCQTRGTSAPQAIGQSSPYGDGTGCLEGGISLYMSQENNEIRNLIKSLREKDDHLTVDVKITSLPRSFP